MRNVHTRPSPDKAAVTAEAYAYIDTVECFFFGFETNDRYLAVKRLGVLKRTLRGGYRLILNQPDKATLMLADRACKRNKGVIVRLDVALDIPGDTAFNREFIASHAVLKWRSKGPMNDVYGTTYWVAYRPGERRRVRRNLVLYADKANRVTGEVECTHFELRLLRADVIRKQGIRSIKDIF